MYRKDTKKLWEVYNTIFDSQNKKAEAFDSLARNFYLGNFGSMQKTDIDVLMFSLFLEEILDKSEADINTYSDYTLSKQLGITQSKVNNLKQKKQLQYPYEGFDWRRSFKRCCSNAKLDGDYIKINLRDVNLYYELQNEIEHMGGYVEGSLTRNLLVITPSDYFLLTSQIMSQEEKDILETQINERYLKDVDFQNQLKKEPFTEAFVHSFKDNIINILFEVLKRTSPGIANIGLDILKTTITTIIKNKS